MRRSGRDSLAGLRGPPAIVARAPRAAVLLEDRAQAAQRPAPSSRLQPAAAGRSASSSWSRGVAWARVSSVHVDARASPPGAGSSSQTASVRMRLNLPPRPRSTMRRGALDLDERQVAPGKRLQRRACAEARAGAAAVGVLARQVPVDQEVVGELRVVRDVGEVVEDLLARAGDRDADGDRVHGAPESSPTARAAAARAALRRRGAGRSRRTVWPCSRAGTRLGAHGRRRAAAGGTARRRVGRAP